jgi:uncharacterized protein (TIGR02246 family)
MKRTIFLSLFFLSGQLLNAQSNDSAGVIKLIEAFRVSLGNGDAKTFSDLFAEDADFTNVVDSSIHGRQNIYKHHLIVFGNRPATRTIHVLSYTMRFLKPDIAAAEIRWDNIHTMGGDGTTLPNRDGVWTSVMTKEKDQWYFKIVRNLFLHDGSPGHELKKSP